MAQRFDFIIVGGGSAGLRAREPAVGGSRRTACWSSRPAGPTTAGTCSSTCPRRWRSRSGSLLRLAVRVRAGAVHGRPAHLPRPRQGARRLCSVNGMIFQRGNPMDYERWAADEGMETWDYAHCLPYFKRMENCLAAAPDDPFRATTGRWCSSGDRRASPLFGAFFAAVQEAGYALTADVNGYRQEGFAAFDRNIHGGRRLSAARAYLHPVMGRPNLTVGTRAFVTRVLFEGNRAVGVEYRAGAAAPIGRGRRDRALRRGDQLAAAAAAVRGRRADRAPRARDRRRPATCPASARTCRTTSRSTSSIAAPSRSRWRPHSRCGTARSSGSSGSLRKRARRHQPLRGRRLRAQQRRGRLPESDVPLPANRGPLRRQLPLGGGGHGYQVHVGPMYSDARGSCKITSAPTRAGIPRSGSTTSRRSRTGASGWRRSESPARSSASPRWAARRRRASPGPGVETDEQILEWVAGRRDRAAPVVHVPDGDRRSRVVDPLSMRVHGRTGCESSTRRSFPYITNGNIYAPVMMLAEKAADLILGNTPLPPQPIAFYRHEGAAATASPRPS